MQMYIEYHVDYRGVLGSSHVGSASLVEDEDQVLELLYPRVFYEIYVLHDTNRLCKCKIFKQGLHNVIVEIRIYTVDSLAVDELSKHCLRAWYHSNSKPHEHPNIVEQIKGN